MKSTMTREEMKLRNARVEQDESRQLKDRMSGGDDKWFRAYKVQLQNILDSNPEMSKTEHDDIVEQLEVFDRALAHEEALEEKTVRWAIHVLRHYQGIYNPETV